MKTTTHQLDIKTIARDSRIAESDEEGSALIASLIADTLNPNTFNFKSIAVNS